MSRLYSAQVFFFFNDTATTEIYTLSLHDALPISASASRNRSRSWPAEAGASRVAATCRRGSTDDGILHSPSRVARGGSYVRRGHPCAGAAHGLARVGLRTRG